MGHFHVRQRARGSREASDQQIGHAVATLEQARARIQEYREDRGSYYVITRSGLCRCSDFGSILVVEDA